MVNRLSKNRADKPARSKQFVYKPRTPDQIKKRADSAGGRFDSILQAEFDGYRPKAGESAIRILPPTWDNHEHFGYDIWVHKYVGPDESNYLCLSKMRNKQCAWCDAAKEAKDAGDTDEYKKLAAKADVIYYVLDRDDDKPMPQVWHVSGMADGEISDLGRSKRTGKTYYLDHPDEGWDILVDKKGAKLRTRYTYKRDADAGPTPIVESQKHQDEILSFITAHPLPSILRFYPNDYLARLAEGGVHEQDEDLDEDSSERGKRRGARKDEDESEEDEYRLTKRSARRGKKEEDEDEDEDEGDGEEENGEEEDADERPRGRGRQSRRDEEEEEDNGESEDAEEEAEEEESTEEEDEPRGRGRSSSRRRGKTEEEEEPDEESEEEGGEEDASEEDEEDRPLGGRRQARTRETRSGRRRVESRRK